MKSAVWFVYKDYVPADSSTRWANSGVERYRSPSVTFFAMFIAIYLLDSF